MAGGRDTTPAAAGASPAMTLSIDVFPAPLRPTSPTVSPACRENDALSTRTFPPTSTVSPRTCNIGPS